MPRALLFAVFAVSILSAQKKPDPCKVSGRLTNSVTNEAVRKAQVSLHPDDPAKTVYTVASDAEGKFHLDNVDPGRYTVEGAKEGFVRPDGPALAIDLKAGKDASDVNLKLTPQGIIAGRVLDDEGEPVSGLMVMPMHSAYVNGHKQLVPVMNGMPIQTNDLGEYRLSGLSPGRYYVHSAARKLVDIQTGGENAQDKEPQEALIPVFFPNAPDAASASQVEVGAGTEVRGIDLRLKKARAQNISGKVLDAAGNPLKSGILMLYRQEPGIMSILPSGTVMLQGQKGEFEIRGVAPGEYNVMAMSGTDPSSLTLVSRLEVNDQPLKDVVMRVGVNADLHVSVRTPAGGDPSALRIVLDVDDNPMASMANAQIAKDGTGVLQHVSPDRYKIMVAGIPQDQYLQSARLGSSDVLENGLDLRNGVAGQLELTIGSPAARLSGTVKNDAGELAKGVTVTVLAKDPKWRTDMTHTATTDQNGRFEVSGMVPAEYRVYAWAHIEDGAAEDEEFRKPYEKFRVEVDLTRTGEPAPVELKVIQQ